MGMERPQPIEIESSFTEFVKEIGGEAVGPLMPRHNPPPNADYLFRSEAVVAELKCLSETTLDAPEHKWKLQALYARWVTEGLVRPVRTERVTINSADLPEKCQRELLSLLRKPIQRVVTKANDQIKHTKNYFGLPQAKGLLLIANDGNYSFESDAVMYHLSHLLRKEHTSIDAVIYFTVNMPAMVPGIERDVLVWVSAPRNLSDEVLPPFLRALRTGWLSFYARRIGQEVPEIACDDLERLADIKFIKR
jgi:hypothetical protein